ncbi:MAG: glycosyltransferase family 4 protein [bacterium]|nr:glycosyltransferase family 4 protein [bacterium]
MPKPHLIFINSMRGYAGAEVWFLETAAALKSRGHKVSIIAQPDSELFERSREKELTTHGVAIRFDAAPWTLIKLHRIFVQQKATCVLANLTKDLKAAATAGWLAKVPLILGSRESDFPLKNKFYYRWYFNRLATGLLVNSRATMDTVLQSAQWLKEENIHLLYKGIDLKKFSPSQHQSPSAKPSSHAVRSFGFAGQLIERKGLLSLMEAWTAVEESGAEESPILKIIGTGPLEPILEKWRENCRYPDNIKLLGHCENMAGFYRNIDVLLMPSEAEGFGLVAAEAMACQVPVIASNSSSLPEIVLPHQNGWLVESQNHEQLTQAILHSLENPSEVQRFGQAARLHIQKNFDKNDTLDRLEVLTGLKPSKG